MPTLTAFFGRLATQRSFTGYSGEPRSFGAKTHFEKTCSE